MAKARNQAALEHKLAPDSENELRTGHSQKDQANHDSAPSQSRKAPHSSQTTHSFSNELAESELSKGNEGLELLPDGAESVELTEEHLADSVTPTEAPGKSGSASRAGVVRARVVPANSTASPQQAQLAKALPAIPLDAAMDHSAMDHSAMDHSAMGTASASEAEQTQPIDEEERQELIASAHRKRFFLSAVPSWLISMMVHVALILALAAISLDPVTRVMNILEASSIDSDQEVETLAQFDLQGPSIDSVDAAPMTLDAPTNDDWVATPEVSAPELFSTQDVSVSQNKITESIMPSALLSSSSLAQMSAALDGRSASKGQMLARFGGTAASEAAVARALKWIAAHQAPDGGWTFAHSQVCRGACGDPGDMDVARNGATALAILPFLGAGQTHVEGQYKANIYKGLAFLIRRLQVTTGADMVQGSWHEPGGRTYSHALAAICLCEAYAMTQDPDLLQPAQLSLNYLVKAQHVQNGGWRYSPGQPGDTSVVGWCLMALKSGKMGGLTVPAYTFQRTDRFLDFVSTNNGAYYGYKEPAASLEGREGTIAVGLLCRMYMGYPKEHPGLQKGIQYLAKKGPSTSDLYYSYYATQVLRHNGGELWDAWNAKMRDRLVESQAKEGHAMGSWYMSGPHTNQGGRLYTTALATMILEVYYRHMPLYGNDSLDDDFEI